MKRYLLLFSILTIAVSNPVCAQISVGAGYLRTQATSELKKVSGDGFYAGLSYRVPLAGSVSLIPGLYFTRTKGQEGEFSWSSFKPESDFYVEKALVAPLHLQWGIDLPSDIRAFLYAGPSFQYGLQCQSPSGLNSKPRDLYSEKDLGPTHQRLNVLVGGGAGISFPIGSTHRIYLTAGWDYGLMNLYVDSSYKSQRSLWKAGVGIEL